MNLDSDALQIKEDQCAYLQNFRIFVDRIERRRGVTDLANATTNPIIHTQRHKQPDGDDLLFGFTKEAIFVLDDGTTWKNVLWDEPKATGGFGIVGETGTNKFADQFGTGTNSNSITNWSTTNFTDLTYGATCIAAGTMPPLPASLEDDGADRVFLYYDQSDTDNVAGDTDYGSWKPLNQYHLYAETVCIDTGTVVVAPVYSSASPIAGGAGGTNEKIPTGLPLRTDGSAYLLWISGGVIRKATANTSGAWIAETGTTISGGSINEETGVWTLDLSDSASPGDDQPDDNTDIIMVYEGEHRERPRLVYNFVNRLICVGIAESSYAPSTWTFQDYEPWRARWTDVNNIDRIQAVTSYIDHVSGDISAYNGGAILRNQLALIREDSIDVMQYVGGPPVFAVETRVNEGSFFGWTWLTHDNYIYGFGRDDFFRFDGTFIESLGQSRIKDYITNHIDSKSVLMARSRLDRRYNEIWFAVSLAEDATGVAVAPKMVLIYSITHNAFFFFRYTLRITAFGEYTEADVLYWNTPDMGTWDDQGLSWSDTRALNVVRSPFLAFSTLETGVMSGQSGTDSGGAAIDADYITRDFLGQGFSLKDRTRRVHVEMKGTSMTSGFNLHFGDKNSCFDGERVHDASMKTLAIDSSYKERQYWMDAVFEHIRYRFRSAASAAGLSIRWLQQLSVTREKD